MASFLIVFMLLSPSAISFAFLASADDKIIPQGASLVPVATSSEDSFWSSSSGFFSFGFYHCYGKGYAIGIWLVGAEKNTTVWTANRNNPPIRTSSSPKLVLGNGKLVLTTALGQETHIANSSIRTVFLASMLNNGNFVLYDKNNKTIWQSFDHPTDTILQGQFLATNANLYSKKSMIDHGTGKFHLDMQQDGNLVLYGTKDGFRPQDSYWSTDTAQSSRPVVEYVLYLNETGLLAVVNRNDSELIQSLNEDYTFYERSERNVTIFRATLDVDGIFRLYSHRRDEAENLKESMLWSSFYNPCQVSGTCGLNSYCTTIDAESKCKCIPGTDFPDSINGRAFDCFIQYTLRECKHGGKENTTAYNIAEMKSMYWSGNPYVAVTMSVDDCKISCMEDCNCGAAMYDKETGTCKKDQLPLKYVRRDLQKSTTAFFKLAKTISSNNTAEKTPELKNQGVTKNNMVQILVLVLGFTMFSFVALAIFGIYAFKIRDLRYKRLMDIGNLSVVGDQLTLRVFSYNDLKRATNGFKEELGKGSFGAVYKGALNRGRKLVAVKRLEKLVEEGGGEFLSEMRAIGRANHKNIVRLLGYCAEGSKRLLVYEYMSYGSLVLRS